LKGNIMKKLLALIIPAILAGSVYADPAPKSSTRVEVTVTKKGFSPDNITVPAMKPVTLVFTRKTDETCAKSVIVTTGDDKKKIERELPLDKPVEIAVTFPKAGTLSYSCGMGMTSGVISVQ